MKAHELLADRSKWTQGCSARNRFEGFVPPSSSDAVSWCAIGALARCYGPTWTIEVYPKVQEVLAKLYPGKCLDEVNDRKGYKAVMRVLREADV